MKVLINSLALPSCRQGGAGFYTGTLIDGLSRAPGVECTALASTGVATELKELAADAVVSVAHARSRRAPFRALNQAIAIRRPWMLDLGFCGTAPEADVTHWPIAFMHGPESRRGGARVLTVHDLQHEFFPEFFSRRDRLLRRIRWRPSAHIADHIVTISEFSKRTICERWEIPVEKVTAVPLAIRETLTADRQLPDLPADLEADGLPWVIYPASPLPAKNHARLLEALAIHLQRPEEDLRLVLIGPTMHSWDPIERAISELGIGDRVLRLGHVDEPTLSAMYRRATGLIFPSLFEGFGLPVLEAMSAGCPVAVSEAGSLPEITNGVGRTFSPLDVEQIADSLNWLMHLSPSERHREATAGTGRAAEFSLDMLTAKTQSVYEDVVSAT